MGHGKISAASTWVSPSHSAKSIANTRITEKLSPRKRVPVASIAPKDATIDAAVIIPSGTDEKTPEDLLAKKLDMPLLWNAWNSSCCRVLHYVGDGGALTGKCVLCRDAHPGRKDIILDPEQITELRKTLCLCYDALMGNVFRPPSNGLLPSFLQGQARKLPQNFEELRVGKRSGLADEDDIISPPSPSHASRGKMAGMTEEDVCLLSYDQESPLFWQ